MNIFTHLYKRNQPTKEPIFGKVEINLSEMADSVMGMAGRLIHPSKSGYIRNHPDHKVYFNACIFDKEGIQIWFGDIDFNVDEAKLLKLAEKVGNIYVTPESPFRWHGLFSKDISKFDKEGIVEYKL